MVAAHRVLVTDDDAAVRDAYRRFFAQQQEFVVCGEAVNGAEGVEAYARLRPEVVLMDLQMPVLSGIDATRQICGRWPEACVVAVTTFGTNPHVVAALRAGAAGYLLKSVGGPALLAGLRQALNGDMPLSSQVRRELVTAVVVDPAPAQNQDRGQDQGQAATTLAPREHETLVWLAQGLSNQQISTRMHVSEGSVKQNLVRIGAKLGVTSRTGILIRAIQLGLVDPHTLPPVQD